MAKASQSVAVEWNDLLQAFEFGDFGGAGVTMSYLCRKTGACYTVSDYTDIPEDTPEDLETSDQYIALPHKKELGLGRSLVFNFVREELPDAWDEVSDIFRRRGAYGRYKDMLRSRGALDKWHAFENAAAEKALREWAVEAGIRFNEG